MLLPCDDTISITLSATIRLVVWENGEIAKDACRDDTYWKAALHHIQSMQPHKTPPQPTRAESTGFVPASNTMAEVIRHNDSKDDRLEERPDSTLPFPKRCDGYVRERERTIGTSIALRTVVAVSPIDRWRYSPPRRSPSFPPFKRSRRDDGYDGKLEFLEGMNPEREVEARKQTWKLTRTDWLKDQYYLSKN
ncbi:hypothetical protein Nepgr_014059 [Nepenthes gracilis]|uniref:Uncharacterized protein n=1 Tax=Nepenthes gracilis TaxID=150966 RepID=A0AAD3SJ80_NEPGR|nr:hypothetical protein Nepgr_014059 [Nepenthes gracilis]